MICSTITHNPLRYGTHYAHVNASPACQPRVKFCPTSFVHVLYGVAWLGFETDVRLRPAETRLFIRPAKYIRVEGAVITGHDASWLGNGSGCLERKKCLRFQGSRRPSRTQPSKTQSWKLTLRSTASRKVTAYNFPVQIAQTSSWMINIVGTSHVFRQINLTYVVSFISVYM